MKHFLTVLLCLLLCGCAPQQTAPTEPAPQVPGETAAAPTYDPDHPMEARYPGQIRAYPLTQKNVHGLRIPGSNVLILSGQDNTTLMLLTGSDLQVAAARTVGFSLTQDDPSLQIHEDCISFFDPRRQETVLLDHRLQEIRSISVPQGISGKPILSADTKKLYYCTPWSVVAWDLESGIRRTVKEIQYGSQELTALHQEDQILACTVTDEDRTEILLLSADNGMELHTLPEDAVLKTAGSGFLLFQYKGFQNLLLFSQDVSEIKMLLPKELADTQHYLEQNRAVITARESENGICLDYYELESGILRASLMLDKFQTPKSIVCGKDRAVYILVYDPDADCDTLYRWDIPEPDASNTDSYTFPYTDPDTPDLEALEACRHQADSIGQKYGITVKLWEDACAVQPWDYQFTPEHLAPVLLKELQLLDHRLSLYPEEVLQKTVSHFTGLTVCLVRSITGTDDGDSLDSATGIQFFEENRAYVAITTGKHSEQALYHELYHVMETHILTKSSALDRWEALNPTDFSYGNTDAPEAYLQGQTRAFVDRYSMESAKEDRARILENAMLPGKEECFRSEYMQRKLTVLCQGIREGYGLKKVTEPMPWEQYLVTPLTPSA